MKRKILVTGGSGFIGSNFIMQQIAVKNMILNLDKLTYAGNHENLKSIQNNNNYQFFHGDICDKNTLNRIISEFKPDALINFAAESHVDRSIDNPINFVETNVLGTAVLLEQALNYWKEKNNNFRLIHISTDEVYGSVDEIGSFTEHSRYNPSSPYSASKASSDHLVRAWHKTYDLPIIITNCSNNYGPYQFPEKLIPLIISNCLDEKPLPLYGDGSNIRDWLYVKDHCNALSTILNKGKIGETYNIGGDNEIKNLDIVKTICKILDKLRPREKNISYSKLITFVSDRPGHDHRYSIDSTKIRAELGWFPKENFDTGIEKTINWYLKNEKWWRNIQNSTYSQERLGLRK